MAKCVPQYVLLCGFVTLVSLFTQALADSQVSNLLRGFFPYDRVRILTPTNKTTVFHVCTLRPRKELNIARWRIALFAEVVFLYTDKEMVDDLRRSKGYDKFGVDLFMKKAINTLFQFKVLKMF
ncbi:hypothetical protein RRG08_028424 [Elysia crispata]|uniref:Uncharacterized protein n=1 Tax=Elysia crispata TaxID=231223 RepID=A0AAE1DSG6_9GAST|nr:hypothetical protein RRG08_028424 [Elysia crispata]